MSAQRLRITLVVLLILVTVSGGAARAAVTSGEASNMTQTAASDLVQGNNAFAFVLYHAVRGQGENLILSPYSISLALAMTYAGARGDTERQMADTLHFALPQDQLAQAFNAFDASLPHASGTGSRDEEFRLNVANALWGQEGYPFRAAYLDLVSQNYGAGLQFADFMADPEAARQRINTWISDQTQERIQDLIQEGVLTTDTRLVLTNAIYFKASWAMQFDPNLTQDGPFTLLDGSQVTVPMMAESEHLGYVAGDGVQAVVLPYVRDRMAMMILLPEREQFDAFESDGFTADEFSTLLDGIAWQEVVLTLPRFEYEAKFGLADTLKGMGMVDAFNPDLADFSGMSDQRDLFISDVLHKAFVKVDETGTEAAASTAVVMGVTSAPMQPVEVHVDHPFLYLIYDQQTGAILFMGRVLNPA